jgi:hypothetical protein
MKTHEWANFIYGTVVMGQFVYSVKHIQSVKGTVLQTVGKCCIMRNESTYSLKREF